MAKSNFYAPYIDGLRAIAVLSVIIYHLDVSWLPGGFTGVDVFFVISGFVVSSSVHQMRPAGILPFMASFYARRVTRIMPALTVCLLVTALASALFIPGSYLSNTFQRTGQAAFFGLSNFVLARRSGDYFSPAAEFNPYTHTWSLGVEEQFYFVFPILFFAWLWGRRHVSVGLFALAFAASLGVAAWLAQVDQTQAFYMIWSRFWELSAGVLLFQAMALGGHSFDAESRPSRLANAGALVSLLVLLAGLLTAQAGKTPLPAALLPVIGTLGLLGFLHGRNGGLAQRWLSLPWMRFIGRISYSLYLWHWPVFVLLRWTSGLESGGARAAAVLLTVVLSLASYRFVEMPTRRLGPGLPRFAVVGAGLALALLGVSTALLIDKSQPSLSLSTVAKHQAAWYVDWKAANADASKCAVDGQELRAADGSSRWLLKRGPCREPATVERTIYVVGDSHAGSYLGMLSSFVQDSGARVELHTRGGCPVLGLRRLTDASCVAYADALLADLRARILPGDVVFLPALRLPRFTDALAEDADQASVREGVWGELASRERAAAEAEGGPLLRGLTEQGAIVVLEEPKPVLMISPYRCSDWFNRAHPSCARGASIPRAFIEDLRQPIVESFRRLAAANPSVRLWDPLPELCSKQTCAASKDGEPLFFDADHLSGHGNKVLLKSFAGFVRALPAQPAVPGAPGPLAKSF